jgi:hypothetical protein
MRDRRQYTVPCATRQRIETSISRRLIAIGSGSDERVATSEGQT